MSVEVDPGGVLSRIMREKRKPQLFVRQKPDEENVDKCTARAPPPLSSPVGNPATLGTPECFFH